MRLFLFSLSTLPFTLAAATLTATLKPPAVNLGNSATLTLRFEGGVANTVQQTTTPKNLALSFVSRKTNTYTYQVTPRVAGLFYVPAFRATVGGKEIQSDPLSLTVFNSDGSDILNDSEPRPPPALLRVRTPVKSVYVGEVFPISMELLGHGLLSGGQLPVPQVVTEGIRFTLIRPNYRMTRARSIDGTIYPNVFLFDTGAIAMKSGKMNLVFELDVVVLNSRRSVFPERQELHLTSNSIALEVVPPPKENQPGNFTGAVGQFQMTASAKPNRVEVGEPIELSATLSGQGALDNALIPEADSWDGFKTYPSTSKIQQTDSLNLNPRKIFQRMIVPTKPTLTHLPALKFSYFNPRTEKYVTITTPLIPIEITGSRMPISPVGDPPGPQEIQTSEDIPKIRMIRGTPGHLADIQPPLIIQPWFLTIPATGLLAFLTAFALRKRAEYLETHPDVARRLHVERITRKTMRTLNSSDSEHDQSAFSASVQLILREHIGMAIDRPAEGITLQTMNESSLRLPNESQKSLERLFQLDELTRFANAPGKLDKKSTLKDLNKVIGDLR